jgi:transcriptional regulator with XRE-family HTH domain
MKLCIDYLKEIQSVKGWTPNRISKELGLSSQRMYQLFNDGGTYNDETAFKVASILGLRPAEVMTSAQFERSKTPEIRAVWEALSEKISEGFNVLMLLSGPRQIRF